MKRNGNIVERMSQAVTVIAFELHSIPEKYISVKLSDRKTIKTLQLIKGYVRVADMLVDRNGYILGESTRIENCESRFKPIREALSVSEIEEIAQSLRQTRKIWRSTTRFIDAVSGKISQEVITDFEERPISYSTDSCTFELEGTIVEMKLGEVLIHDLEQDWGQLIAEWYIGI